MIDRICMVCKEYNTGINQVIRLKENNGKDTFDIEGHVNCTDELFEKIKNVKNPQKKSIRKVLEEVGLVLDI